MYPKLKPLSLKSVNRSYSDESCTHDNWNGQNPYCTFVATHCKTLYVPCMKIKLNKPIYVCYFPQIMLFFLNHQSLHCQASEEILEYQFEHHNEHQSILCTTWTSISVVYFGGQRLRLPRRESQATSLVLCS